MGPRKILHIKECEICGYNEYYFIDPETNKQLGMACEGCNYIKRFEFNSKN
ncbi:acyltransferase [Psychrobacillus sp. AK 1817]|nr:acyltransferase [Psychrobacillus sp. AK 1817]